MNKFVTPIFCFMIIYCIKSYGQLDSKINLTPFDYKGQDIDGCSEAYYSTLQDRSDQQNTIFISDFTTAIVYINGKMYKLKMTTPYNKYHSVYKNAEYKIDVQKSNYIAKDFEYYIMNVEITIYKNNKIVYNKKVLGDGGC